MFQLTNPLPEDLWWYLANNTSLECVASLCACSKSFAKVMRPLMNLKVTQAHPKIVEIFRKRSRIQLPDAYAIYSHLVLGGRCVLCLRRPIAWNFYRIFKKPHCISCLRQDRTLVPKYAYISHMRHEKVKPVERIHRLNTEPKVTAYLRGTLGTYYLLPPSCHRGGTA
jgi:hypothetical protein